VKKLLLAGVAVLAIASISAHAEVYTGSALMRDCSGYGNGLGFCNGFVLGVSNETTACRPKGATGLSADQLRVIAIRYVNNIPQRWHVSAGTLVSEAFKQAFPCQ